MAKVVAAFGDFELVEQFSDDVFEFRDGPCGGGPEQGFELGEDLLDRIEVGTVGRQVDKFGTDRLDGFADTTDFVAGEIVHDHQVAGTKRGDKLLLDIGPKHVAVHRSIHHQRRRDTIDTEPCDQCRRLPMTVGNLGHQAMTAGSPAASTGHLGIGTRFIDEDQSAGVEVRPPKSPCRTSLSDIWPVLLSGMHHFF